MAVMQKIRDILRPEVIEIRGAVAIAPQSTYEIFPLTLEHLNDVLRLNLRCFVGGENYTRQTFKHLLTEPNVLSYRIVTSEKHLAGFVFVFANKKNVAHITTIGIAPEHRKRGLAKKLLKHVEAALLRRNFDSIVLEVRVNNYKAQNLYHKLDYSIIQKIEGYYSNGEAAFLMAKNL